MFNACTVPTPLLRIVTASLNLLILTGSWRGIELWFLSVKKKKNRGLEILISFSRIMKLMSEWQSVFQTPTLITKEFFSRVENMPQIELLNFQSDKFANSADIVCFSCVCCIFCAVLYRTVQPQRGDSVRVSSQAEEGCVDVLK